jgi:predicted ABC-type ATPase
MCGTSAQLGNYRLRERAAINGHASEAATVPTRYRRATQAPAATALPMAMSGCCCAD